MGLSLECVCLYNIFVTFEHLDLLGVMHNMTPRVKPSDLREKQILIVISVEMELHKHILCSSRTEGTLAYCGCQNLKFSLVDRLTSLYLAMAQVYCSSAEKSCGAGSTRCCIALSS